MGTYPDNFDDNRDVRYFECRVFLNGAGAIDNTQNVGNDFTVTRTGVGTATAKINVVAKNVLFFGAELSKQAVLARMLHKLGVTQGADGMWTLSLALTDLNNAGVAAQEWAAANAAAYIDFKAVLQMGDRTF